MTASRTRPLTYAAVAAALLSVSVMAAGPAVASDGVEVTNAETVQVYLSPSGEIDTQRVYEQLGLTGKGEVDLENPVSTDHLRNLDGFSGFDVHDGRQVVRTDVDGKLALRSVSDYDGKLPLKVTAHYELDGKEVSPGDVVGADGDLEVSWTVENVTGTPQRVSFDDGHGGTVEKTVEVPIPIVGTLTTTAPAQFTDVRSEQANMGGDGHGGTQLSYTMTLFPPIGDTSTTIGYTAHITDGVVPRAEISALPVDPLASPTFKTAAASYQGGADSGLELTDGASQIDGHLLELRDGASKLLAGLIKLDDGAAQLSTGLNDDAVPGSEALADGAGQLDDGLGQLSDGAGQLSDGTGRALAGSRDLRDGLGRISGGLAQLADAQSGLPAATNGITRLRDGVDELLAGFGDRTDPTTLIGGLAKLHTGLLTAEPGAKALDAGVAQLADPATGLPAAKAGVDLVLSGLQKAGPQADELTAALNAVKGTTGCQSDPACTGTIAGILPQVAATKTQLQLAAGGLGQVSTGLDHAVNGVRLQLAPGMHLLAEGVAQAADGSGQLLDGAEKAQAGLGKVRGGLGALAEGVHRAVAGVFALNTGARTAFDGGSALAGGLAELDSGAGRLAAGAGDAKDGSAKVADGAGQLADGLRTAADGSTQLSDGLGEARDGAPQLVDGAQRLSDEGTSVLVGKGEETAQSYGEMVAVMKAGAKRAQSENMAFGAPEGAIGLTAYSYVLQGADGEGSRNLVRGLAGVAILAAGAGVFALRRRGLLPG